MFYIITDSTKQIDDGPFDTRAEAEAWIATKGQAGIRYSVLDEVAMDELEAAA